MSSSEVYDYYDFQLNNICVGKIEKIKVENLSEGYETYICLLYTSDAADEPRHV